MPKEEKNSPFPTKSVLNRLHSLKQDRLWKKLFTKGRSFREGPYTLVVLPHHEFKIGFAVPKRLFNRANQRNRIKRILREASATALSQHRELPPAMFLVKYGHPQKEVPSYKSACRKLLLLFNKGTEVYGLKPSSDPLMM